MEEPTSQQESRSKYQESNGGRFDLTERCTAFAKTCKKFIFTLPEKGEDRTVYGRQLLRSSGSIGANYIEANNGLGKKDFIFRLRIARKEAVESAHWLEIIDNSPPEIRQECKEIKNILSAIIQKVS